MTQTAFVCRRCGAELTDFLDELDEGSLQFVAGEPVVPSGAYVRLSRPWSYRDFLKAAAFNYLSSDGELVAFDAGDCLLNEADVRHRIAKGAVHGCCGWQPRDEANAVCLGGHAIGTLHSDECWSPIVFRLLGEAVEAIG
jgi:hypothetical protein